MSYLVRVAVSMLENDPSYWCRHPVSFVRVLFGASRRLREIER